MNRVLLFLTLCVGMASAWDECQPLAPKQFEASLSVFRYLEGDKAFYPELALKAGLVTGLDVELNIPGALQTGASGFDQPTLALKYALPGLTGWSALVGASAPIGADSVMGEDSLAVLDFAGMFEFSTPSLTINGFVSYSANVNALDRGALDGYFIPYYAITEKFGAYLGLEVSKPLSNDGPTYFAYPGLSYLFTDVTGISGDFDIEKEPATDPAFGIGFAVYTQF
jgi:hypothetical protein